MFGWLDRTVPHNQHPKQAQAVCTPESLSDHELVAQVEKVATGTRAIAQIQHISDFWILVIFACQIWRETRFMSFKKYSKKHDNVDF